MKKIWITWEQQRRNVGISSGVGAELFVLISTRNRIARYLELSIRTLIVILKTKPDILFAQNPSIVLSALVVMCKRIFGYRVVIDAHNSGIYPFESRYFILNEMSRYVQRKASMIIVTNKYLCLHVEKNGGKVFVLPDCLPTPPRTTQTMLKAGKNIIFICTFSNDEPYLEVFKAAKRLGVEYTIYFTGNYKDKVDGKMLPRNVELLGYLPEDEYWAVLSNADAIMDLTTREGCLVCGAYEGLSLEKPLVLSNTVITKEYFKYGCVYVDPDSRSIAEGIRRCFSDYDEYKKQITILKILLREEWEEKRTELIKELSA